MVYKYTKKNDKAVVEAVASPSGIFRSFPEKKVFPVFHGLKLIRLVKNGHNKDE